MKKVFLLLLVLSLTVITSSFGKADSNEPQKEKESYTCYYFVGELRLILSTFS